MNLNINRLEHILEAIDRIIEFTDVDFALYQSNLEKQDAVSVNFIRLGEAAAKLSSEIRSQYPDVPWRNVIGMRNILVHDYVKVDFDELWYTAKNDLPSLKIQIGLILKQLAAK